MTYIYPYNKASESAKLLAQALGIKKIKREGSNFKGSRRKTVINWGCTSLNREILQCNIINHSEAVKLAANKLDCFRKLSHLGVSTVPWTTDWQEVLSWLESGAKVVARHKLESSEGKGIEIFTNPLDLERPAPLYTKYIKKTEEYRIHVCFGRVIDVTRKALRNGGEPNDVRNHANGYVFAREGVVAPDKVLHESLCAVDALGLDFGAVDIIWNRTHDKAYVLEINTAPGIEGTTLERYARALQDL